MRTIVISIIMAIMASGALAVEPKNTYVSTDLGISIEPPIAKDSKVSSYQIAMFFLPVSDNFAANVNVQKQLFVESIETYDTLTKDQFKQYNMTVLKRTLKGQELRYEYKGELQGRTMHWYARAVKSGQHIYLVTATGLDSQWKQQRSLLMRSVDSFAATH